jgi:hypothetical protein
VKLEVQLKLRELLAHAHPGEQWSRVGVWMWSKGLGLGCGGRACYSKQGQPTRVHVGPKLRGLLAHEHPGEHE